MQVPALCWVLVGVVLFERGTIVRGRVEGRGFFELRLRLATCARIFSSQAVSAASSSAPNVLTGGAVGCGVAATVSVKPAKNASSAPGPPLLIERTLERCRVSHEVPRSPEFESGGQNYSTRPGVKPFVWSKATPRALSVPPRATCNFSARPTNPSERTGTAFERHEACHLSVHLLERALCNAGTCAHNTIQTHRQ